MGEPEATLGPGSRTDRRASDWEPRASRWRSPMVRLAASAIWLLVPLVVPAQSRDTATAKARPPADHRERPALAACCRVVRLDTASAVVTARETATGYTFRFEVKSRQLRASLKIGDPVWADFAAKTVRLETSALEPCCKIASSPPPD